MIDINFLKENGWTVECKSPLEIRHEDGSFATLNAAYEIMRNLSEDIKELCYNLSKPNSKSNVEDIKELYIADIDVNIILNDEDIKHIYGHLLCLYFQSQQNGLVNIDSYERAEIKKLLKLPEHCR